MRRGQLPNRTDDAVQPTRMVINVVAGQQTVFGNGRLPGHTGLRSDRLRAGPCPREGRIWSLPFSLNSEAARVVGVVTAVVWTYAASVQFSAA